jgi:beta-barrel assembly-enhancing protease
MFKKFLIQLFIFLAIVALIWFGLSRLNFKKATRIDQRIEQLEEKLGDVFLNIFKQQHQEIYDPEIHDYLEYLLKDLFKSNDIDPGSIDIYLLRSSTVNAFALPGRNIILLSGLVDFTETPEEFIGVVAHEIAHVESDHVMRKLSREVGIAVLFAAVSGNYNMELLREVAKLIASNTYSRSLEIEADLLAVEYMINAGYNPRGLADLFHRFAEELDILPRELQWISTHPASVERAEMLEGIIEEMDTVSFKEPDMEKWNQFKNRLKGKQG